MKLTGAFLVFSTLLVAAVVALALAVTDHPRYETKTSNGLTIRLDKKTGATDVLEQPSGACCAGMAWRRLNEPTPPPAVAKADQASPAECARIRGDFAGSVWARDAMLKVRHCI